MHVLAFATLAGLTPAPHTHGPGTLAPACEAPGDVDAPPNLPEAVNRGVEILLESFTTELGNFHALEALLGLARGFALPGAVELEKLVLFDAQQLLA